VIDLQRRVLDPELLLQHLFECAAHGVAIGVRCDEDVGRQKTLPGRKFD
jgi:hypothetical protein